MDPPPKARRALRKKKPREARPRTAKEGHEGHEGHGAGDGDVEGASAENAAFAAAANGCLVAGDACLAHIGHRAECKACFEACNETIEVAKTCF